MRIKRNLNVVFHVIFWVIVCRFFIRYSIIRPGTSTMIYKELLSVIFIAMMVYINYLYLIPKYFQTNRLTIYWSLALLTILAASVGEFIMVKSNIILCVGNAMPPDNLKKYLRIVLLLTTLRNASFFLFFFLYKIYNDITDKYIQEKQAISKKTHSFFIMSQTTGEATEINISDLAYMSQEKNSTYFYLVDGSYYTQLSSLSRVEETFPENTCLRINRQDLVVISQVIDFDENSVTLDFIKDGKHLTLFISPKYKSEVLSVLANTIKKSDVINVENSEAAITDKAYKLSYSEEMVLSYIKENPGIKIKEIAEGVSLSPETVTKHIRTLKYCKLIEFRGVTRYGGYFGRSEK